MEKVSLVKLVSLVLDSKTAKVIMSEDKYDVEIRGTLGSNPVSIKLSTYIPDNIVDFMRASMICSVSCNVYFLNNRVYHASNVNTEKLNQIASILNAYLENEEKEADNRIYDSFEDIIGGTFMG